VTRNSAKIGGRNVTEVYDLETAIAASNVQPHRVRTETGHEANLSIISILRNMLLIDNDNVLVRRLKSLPINGPRPDESWGGILFPVDPLAVSDDVKNARRDAERHQVRMLYSSQCFVIGTRGL
jgi:hypothetical protein